MTEMFLRPHFNNEDIHHLILRLYGLKIKSISQLDSCDDLNYRLILDGFWVKNNFLKTIDANGYVLKILNSQTSKNMEALRVQHEMIKASVKAGINTALPVLNINGDEWSLEQLPSEGNSTDNFIVRLFNYIPGQPIKTVVISQYLAYQIGSVAGKLDQYMKNISQPNKVDYSHWNMESIPDLLNILHLIKNQDDRQLLREIIVEFNKMVLSRYDSWQKGYIHSDINEGNVLVVPMPVNHNNNQESSSRQQPAHEFKALIDFGDSTYSLYIFEISIAMMYLMVQTTDDDGDDDDDVIKLPRRALVGYLEHLSLTNEELSLLKLCVSARLAQSFIRGTLISVNESVVDCQKSLRILKILWAIPSGQIIKLWTDS